MGIENPVVIRMEVESMKHSILHAFTNHQIDMQRIVADALKGAIDETRFVDGIRKHAIALFEDEVKKQVQHAIWKFGISEAAKTIIEQGVLNGLHAASDDAHRREIQNRLYSLPSIRYEGATLIRLEDAVAAVSGKARGE